MDEAVLVSPTLVRLPNGKEIPLGPGLLEFRSYPGRFTVRYDRGPKTQLKVWDTGGNRLWFAITRRSIDVRVTDDGKTVLLPYGSVSFAHQVDHVLQAGSNFIGFADTVDAETGEVVESADER